MSLARSSAIIKGPFVAGRLISHNILLCHDLVKHYSRKHYYPSCIIKVDLRKAYDTMDCAFIHDMLIALNFPPHFIKIIMVCITSTQYSLLVNGCPLEGVQAQKRFEAR